MLPLLLLIGTVAGNSTLWQKALVRIHIGSQPECWGIAISSEWALTVAHCAENPLEDIRVFKFRFSQKYKRNKD